MPRSLHVSLINLIHAYVINLSAVRPSLTYLDGLLIYLNPALTVIEQLSWLGRVLGVTHVFFGSLFTVDIYLYGLYQGSLVPASCGRYP